MRARGGFDFRDAVTEAAALHAHDELFSEHIELEPAPEDPVGWAMAEASNDEDDAPMPDAPLEPELIDMPPAPAQIGAVHRTALGIWRWTALTPPKKMPPASHLSVSLSLLSHVSVVSCVLARTRVSTS